MKRGRPPRRRRQRLEGDFWTETKARIAIRDKRCRACSNRRQVATDPAHVIPLGRLGTRHDRDCPLNEDRNLLWLCRPDHTELDGQEGDAARWLWLVQATDVLPEVDLLFWAGRPPLEDRLARRALRQRLLGVPPSTTSRTPAIDEALAIHATGREYRADGEVLCLECNYPNRLHPLDPRVPGVDGPFLVLLCTGDRVKL